jgi:hypothetical protein
VGIVSLGMNLRDVVARWAAFVTEISEHKYGHAPLIKVTSTTTLDCYYFVAKNVTLLLFPDGSNYVAVSQLHFMFA